MKIRPCCAVVGFLFLPLFVFAQAPSSSNTPASSASTQVPRLIRFSGIVKDASGKAMTGVLGITFSLYKDQQGEAPLWTETQNVQPDSSGHYTVLLGSTKTTGVPAEMFVSGEAQWLGVQPQGEAEQARVLIVSVPYALKALDAETVGGKPASAFMAAPNFTGSGSGGVAVASTGAAPNGAPTLSGGGTKDYVPLWLSSTKLGSSKLYQSTAGNVGVGTKTPVATLDVNGTINTSTSFNLGGNIFAFGSYANASAFLGFAGNSTMTGVENNAVGEGSLLANTTGDSNTAVGYSLPKNTAGSWNAGIGVNTLLNNTVGNFNSALGSFAGQTLDSSNVTGSNDTAAGAGAAFGTGSVTNATAIGSNSVVNESNALVLGSIKGLNGATSNVNVGVGTATPAAMLDVNGVINTSTSFNLGGSVIAFGSASTGNAFLGFAGNSTVTGKGNTASGHLALGSNTTGVDNTASGVGALFANSTGSSNTASGHDALQVNTIGEFNVADGSLALQGSTTGADNTASGAETLRSNTTGSLNSAIGFGAGQTGDGSDGTGSYDTAVGAGAVFGTGSLTNATVIGANATVSQSNALVLGAPGVNVGIGTATPSDVFTIAQGAGHAISDGWDTYSSRRWKTNIQTLQGALGKVEQLRGVSYDLKATGKHEVGVIAEEVGVVVPEVVTWDKTGKDAQSVDYSRLIALMIEATKEQQREIRSQQTVLRTQAAAIRGLKSELRATRQTLEKVKAQVATAQPTLVAAK